jgi:hypothetical protein
MGRVTHEPIRVLLPLLTDKLVGCKPFERFKPFRQVVCHNKRGEVLLEGLVNHPSETEAQNYRENVTEEDVTGVTM